jgi:hypothetical protein
MKCSTDIRTTLCPCTMSRGELVQQMPWGKWGQCNTFLASWDRNSLFSKFCEYKEILIVDCILSHFPLMKLSTFGRGFYCIEGPLAQKPYFLDCAMYIVANVCMTHEHLLVHPVGHCWHLNWGL